MDSWDVISGEFLYHIGPLELDISVATLLNYNQFVNLPHFLLHYITVRRILYLYQLSRVEIPMHNIKCLLTNVKHLEMSLWLLEGHDCIQYSLSFNFQIAALLIMSYHVINCVDSVPHVFSTNNSFSVE